MNIKLNTLFVAITDCVVIGEGAGIDYESLTVGINLIFSNKAILVATNPDINVDARQDGQHLVLPGGGLTN